MTHAPAKRRLRFAAALAGTATFAGGLAVSVAAPAEAAGGSCAPTLIAHRGLTEDTYEETLPSYREAIRAGSHMLEGDVRFTSDDVAVMLHDATVDRTTDGTGEVAAMTYSEVQQLDAGGGAAVPALSDLVSLAVRHGVRLVLELKEVDVSSAHVKLFLDILRGQRMVAATTVQSFDPDNLQLVRSMASHVRTGLLFGDRVPSVDVAQSLGSVVLPEKRLVTRRRVRRWHRAGLASYTWTLNTRTAWIAAAGARVDAIMTDRPLRYARWARRRC